MCGICGHINPEGKPIDPEILLSMRETMRHRGPDDDGLYIKQGSTSKRGGGVSVGLGHRRLSIIDLSRAGRQPMCNSDGKIWIVYNGEVYNFEDLRRELIARGYRFKSRTDTEIVLYAYQEFSTEFLSRLRGMFAFAIWDEEKNRLFLARDRLGQKPLFYSLGKDGSLSFASSLCALLADTSVPRDIDHTAIDLYLTYQYVPAPLTAFKAIKKLPPAHFLVWEKGNLLVKRYWALDYNNKLEDLGEAEIAEALLEKLRESIELRMISDVPLGAFLSGGIDSSLIVALMSDIHPEPIRTFSIGFEESSYNELPYARVVAGKYCTEHHEFKVRPNALDILPDLVFQLGEPFADASIIPTYCVSRLTRDYVTVALNGDGGDENFFGYDRYVAYKYGRYYRKSLKFLNPFLLKLLTMWPESPDIHNRVRRVKRFLEGMAYPCGEDYIKWVCHFDKRLKSDIYTNGFRTTVSDKDAYQVILTLFEQSTAHDPVEKILDFDMRSYLANDLLVKADIASMANSLEARSPFLDHHLMEYVARIPVHLRLRHWTKKYILKKVAKPFLPHKIVKRPKMGFGVPLGYWFRNELKSYAADLLLGQQALSRGYFKKDAIRTLVREHMAGGVDHGDRLWSLLILELWHRTFVDR
ncbi:MAG: asparagine synthase (glutamine-hydrolyzing) [Deltaproteobacteria bacterium]|nr:MAG: asparagine synthase (glutamine-hydrolyzing) [Deltaproteobacteria bacterium]